MKMVSLKQPCNQKTKSLLCPNTPNTMVNCICALVRQRDGDTRVVMIVDIDFCNRNNKKQQGSSNKSEQKRYAMLENEA